jgi:hypothetical protein
MATAAVITKTSVCSAPAVLRFESFVLAATGVKSIRQIMPERLEEIAWEYVFSNNLTIGEAQEIHKHIDRLP